MASVRIDALFLLAFFVVLDGVNSAVFQQSDYKQRPSAWSAEMSALDMLSLVKILENENTADVKSVKGCCTSEIWASTMFTEFINEEGERKEITHCKDVISVDPVTKRWADDQTLNNDATISKIILCDESGSILYNFSKTERWCKTSRQSACPGFQPMCFSSNGTLVGSFNFGAGPGALKTELWNYRSSDRGGETSINVLLTPDDCVPILRTDETKDSAMKKKFFAGSVFTNYATWIPDPSVFTPPSYCYNKEDETLTFGSQKFYDTNALFSLFK